MRSIAPGALLGVLLASMIAAPSALAQPARFADGCARPAAAPGARAAALLHLTYCGAKTPGYDAFVRDFDRFQARRIDALPGATKALGAISDATGVSSGADASSACDSRPPLAASYADLALQTHLPPARRALDRMALALAGMKRVAPKVFVADRDARFEADRALTALDGRVAQYFRLLSDVEASANAIKAGNCEGARALYDAGAPTLHELSTAMIQRIIDLTKALQLFANECRDTVLVQDLFSAKQIERRAGAKGVRRANAGPVSIVAPTSVSTGRLPLSLNTKAAGRIEVRLDHGGTFLAGAGGGTSGGGTGLVLKLPRTAPAGAATLEVTFTPPIAETGTRTRLTVRIVRP